MSKRAKKFSTAYKQQLKQNVSQMLVDKFV